MTPCHYYSYHLIICQEKTNILNESFTMEFLNNVYWLIYYVYYLILYIGWILSISENKG
jgi:hypothetical protein